MSSHMGRAFTGHAIEDACPCPKEACGLVSLDAQDPECPQHAFRAAKTMRQGHLGRDCPALSPREWAAAQLENLDTVIAYMESTNEDAWNLDTVRSKDGTKNCFFGHLFNMSPDEARANALWGMFEDLYSTSYVIYPINDGTNPRYPQATPKQRILAYLRALQAGDEKTTEQSMEECYQLHLAEEAKKRPPMPRNKKPLRPEIADGLLLGLALLTDADADVSQLEAPPQEAVVGLLCVAQLALGDVIAATGKAPGAALAEVRALALSMADEDFAESAETMWAAVYLEASREWPDLHTGQAVTALRHGAGGLSGAAAILMVMAANHRGIAEQDVIDEYRALAIESLATA